MTMLDLFSDNNIQQEEYYSKILQYKSCIGDEWYSFLGDSAKTYALHAIENNPKKSIPSIHTAFGMFRRIRPKDVKVVICSICPYPDGNNTGVAFECINNIKPSLEGIYKGLYYSHGKTMTYTPPNLDWLINQGVMLINSKLTILPGDSNSNSNIRWQDFITSVLSRLSFYNKNLIILFVGGNTLTKGLQKKIKIPAENKMTLIHPVSTQRIHTVWDCKEVIEKANEILVSNNETAIKWLPEIPDLVL